MLYSDSIMIESFWLIDDVFEWGLIDRLPYLKHEKPMWINGVTLFWFLLCFSRELGRSRRSRCSRAFVKAVNELLHTQFRWVLTGRWLIQKLKKNLSNLKSKILIICCDCLVVVCDVDVQVRIFCLLKPRRCNFFIYVYKMIHFKKFKNFNHIFMLLLTQAFHYKKTYKQNAKKRILFQSNHQFEKNKKIHVVKINNTCVYIESSSNHNIFLWLKNLICWNIKTLWRLFLSNILNLFLIKQNWYLKKREIHCFFQLWFDDAWNVISKNYTIHVKTKFVKKS